jgi:hypothetical protein
MTTECVITDDGQRAMVQIMGSVSMHRALKRDVSGARHECGGA